MEIKKVKDWLEDQQCQFDLVEIPSGDRFYLDRVIRIKDGLMFMIGDVVHLKYSLITSSFMKITSFVIYDRIHVTVSGDINNGEKFQINDLILWDYAK